MSAPPAAAPRPVTHIRATAGGSLQQGRELWSARELLYMLAWRDVRVRYKHTLVGVGWAVAQPLLTVAVLDVFSRLLGIAPGSAPYPVLALSGLVPWLFLIHALTLCSGSLVDSAALISKIYFPRILVPMASVLGAAVDLVVAASLLPLFLLYYGVHITAALAALPLFLLLLFAIAYAAGLWLAALNVQYRDVANALPFIAQLWFFLTPIAYPAHMIPERWWFVAGLNPMTGMIEGLRWSLFGQAHPALAMWVLTSFTTTVVLLASGWHWFRRREAELIDVL